MSKRRRSRPTRSVTPLEAPSPERSQPVRLRAALIALVTVLTYWNSLSAPFTFDDDHSIVLNTQIRRLWPLSDVLSPWRPDQPVAGRPFVTLSLAINYAVGELDVWGYHLVNIGLHVLCALVLFGIIRRTLRVWRLAGPPAWHPRWGALAGPPARHSCFAESTATNLAFAGALVWAVHPLQTETVDYISARTESMMGLFFLLTLYTSIRANSLVEAGLETRFDMHSGRWLVLSALSCAAGMGCKETMGVAPVVVLVYDRSFVFESFSEALRRRWKFYFALAASWLPLAALLWWGPRSATAGFSVGVTPWTYLLNQSMMIVRYLRLAFWPQGLVIDYGVPQPLTSVQAAPYGAVIIALLLVTIAAMRWRPPLGFLGAWFFLILAPTSSIVPIATEVGAERRMYLPLAAVVMLVVLAAHRSSEYLSTRLTAQSPPSPPPLARVSAGMTLVLVSAALAVGTVRRNTEYQSGLTLWRTDLERWPQARAHRNLAAELKLAGYRDEVVFHMREAARDQPEARYGLGLELFDQGKYSEAVEELQRFVRERPQDPHVSDAHGLLARAMAVQGHPTQASEHLRLVLKARPNDVEAWGGLGFALQAADQMEQAAAAFNHAVMLNPHNAVAQRNLAAILLDQQDFTGAVTHAEEAVRLTPRDAAARTLHGLALIAQLRFDDAIGEFRAALELDPSDNRTRQYLERALKLKKSS